MSLKPLAVLAALLLGGALVTPALAASSQSLAVTALVQDQACVGSDFVRVTLSATVDSTSQPVVFRWDFQNDGTFDSRPRQTPTVARFYPDETAVTARIGARNAEGNVTTDTVTFDTLRCP